MAEERTFHIGPIRPPSEAASLLLQVTRGCTWNRCRFCNLYRDTHFKAYSADEVKRDIDVIAAYAEEIREFCHDSRWDLDGLNLRLGALADGNARQCFYMVAQWLLNGGENVFLQDGNTTALSSGRLSDVLIYLKKTFPQIRRITSYGRAEELSRHDAEYYAELKAAGLDRIHSGFETGSDRVLEMIHKGTTAGHEITAGKNIRAGGIELSVYFMPGIGGRELSRDNAEGTARVLNEVDPDFLRIRTAAVKPGTELYEDFRKGWSSLCSDDEKIREIRRVIELAKGVSTRLVSDHMVNLLQDVEGSLGSAADRKRMLGRIDQYLELEEVDRRVFQLLRRTLRAYDLDDLQQIPQEQMEQIRQAVSRDSDKRWNEKINEYISRYI
ncbi:MAG: radical SAM protein [Firmicutes bacterium]|nr:radical SAM protein [Bacillota bacterium]